MNNPYELISSNQVYKNKWIRVREDKVINPDNSDGFFGIVEMIPGSTVLALNKEKEVYLVKEYRYGIERESIELMSGGLKENESPLDGAKRELQEELGLGASSWIDLGKVDPFTTIVNSPNYLFLAYNLEELENNPDKEEVLEIYTVPFDTALNMVQNGEITHSASCVLILKAARYLEKLSSL